MELFLFFLRKFSQLHALLEPPRLLIFEELSQLHEPPSLFILGEIPNYKIILSSYKLLYCCFNQFKVISKSHTKLK